jgi:hypothetical protein
LSNIGIPASGGVALVSNLLALSLTHGNTKTTLHSGKAFLRGLSHAILRGFCAIFGSLDTSASFHAALQRAAEKC